MFKLESYVTPLLLSYVDKYIKNLKPEDSQLSLWGGDAVFCNLDLRLDVLEQELQLPFTFVNGHIHELRIHVPWTKLGSEPVVITINTIECVLKLHNDSDVSGRKPKVSSTALSRKYAKKQETSEAPPGYVQSLINRVVSNISIICNNLILKYVEDDIVLSLNIKSAELFSVNDKWERAFVEVHLPDVIVRKVICMQDLTVCLDKRDASGKIETYQDPLLYRCSTTWRLYSLFNMPHSKYPSVTRINMFCDQLDFSLTDQQLPMFLRLMKLCLALQYKDAYLHSGNGSIEDDSIENKSQGSEDDLDETEMNSAEETWGSWAWSFVPQVLPVWSDEGTEESDKETDQSNSNKIFQFGIFIDKASCVFKKTDAFQDTCYASPKFTFSPLAVLHQYGCSMEITIKGKDFLNVQLGVSGAKITGLDECVCGCKDVLDTSATMEKLFFRAGVPPGTCNTYNFLTSTLFDPLAPENCGLPRKYCFDQEQHLAELTEEVLVKRFPAFALDYLYELEIPEDFIDKASVVTSTFLEDSNWHESSICRLVLGPFSADVTSNMVHFLIKLLHCAGEYDYPPYSRFESRKQSLNSKELSEDDVQLFEEFIPLRYYHLTLFKPVLRLSVADHSHYDASAKIEKKRLKKRNKKFEKHGNVFKSALPLLSLEISADCVDLQSNTPMYPSRVARIVSSLASPSENLIYHCYAHHSFKLFGWEVMLLNNHPSFLHEGIIIPKSSISLFKKSIIMPEYWIRNADLSFEEIWIECGSICSRITELQFLSLLCIYQSWMSKEFNFAGLSNSSIFQMKHEEKLELSCEVHGVEYISLRTLSVTAHKGAISSIDVKLQNSEHSTVLVHAPESTSDTHKGKSFFRQPSKLSYIENFETLISKERWLQFVLQIPNKLPPTTPLLLVIEMSGITFCLEPALLSWLSCEAPKVFSKNVADCLTPASPTDFEDDSTCSSQTPVASGSQSISRSQSVFASCTEHSGLCEDVGNLLFDYYFILKYLVLQVEIQSCVLLFPNYPWSVDGHEKSTVLNSWQQAFAKKQLIAACVVCFPKLTLKNNSSHNILEQDVNIVQTNLPVSFLREGEKYHDCFPWTLKISDFSMYTIDNQQSQEDIFFFWSPSTASTTIAITSKPNQDQLALCIHVDTTALNINGSASQVQLIVDCLNALSVCSKFIDFVNSWMTYLQQKSTWSHSLVRNHRREQSDNPEDLDQPKVVENAEKCKGALEGSNTEKSSSTASISKPQKKVTLWIQLALPKFSINLFGKLNSEDNQNFRFQFISEEVITSLDIQEVYSKAKIKLSSLNINCFKKKDKELQWQPGPYEGIILCSSNKLQRNIKTTASNDNSTSGHRSTVKMENQPFLLLTYTQALCMNAKQKWTSNLKQNLQISEVSKYISEVDINVRPFDLILWVSMFKVIYNTCSPLLKFPFLASQNSPALLHSDNELKGIGFSNQTLPLLYIKTNVIRLFLPKCKFSSLSLMNDNISSGKSRDYIENPLTCTTKALPDTLLLHLDHITLTSQVDNPLSRIILNADLYAAALSSKTISLPGSDIEDRQYQLDICGLSFGSVVGHDITRKCHIKKETPSSHPPIMGENPALEWNIGVVNESRKYKNQEPVLITPIMSPLDIRFAVAPAIVCNHPSLQDSTKNVIVAGITTEISVTSDIFIYLSIQQIHLLGTVLDNNLDLLFPIVNRSSEETKFNRCGFKTYPTDMFPDSGIESEASTLHHSCVGSDSLNLQVPINMSETFSYCNFVPFEILVTAGSVSVMLFVHEGDFVSEVKKESQMKDRVYKSKVCDNNVENKELEEVFPCNSLIIQSNETAFQSNLSLKKISLDDSPCTGLIQKVYTGAKNAFFERNEADCEGSSDSSESETLFSASNEKNVQNLYPFLFISVTQPHTFIRCNPSSQRFETSFFDLQIRGSCMEHYIKDTDTCVVPTVADFTLPYLETKPGEANEKTGIPPALCTISCTDFLREPAKVKLCVERPVKLNLSTLIWNQIEIFMVSLQRKMLDINLWPQHQDLHSTNEKNISQQGLMHPKICLSRFGTLEFSTTQVILEVDIAPNPKTVLLIIGVDGFEIKVETAYEEGIMKKLSSHLIIKGVVLKTTTTGQLWPIILPMSATVSVKCHMNPWFEVKVHVKGETIFLNCGLKHILSLETVLRSIIAFLKAKNITPFGETSNIETPVVKVNSEKNHSKKLHWNDDLRKGLFHFVQASDGHHLPPNVYEIVFTKAQLHQPAAMTWCYPEPRALTKIEISPVPFRCSVSKGDKEIKDCQQVACYLQYWDSLHHEFMSMYDFELSETAHCSLEFPLFGTDLVAVSDVWRVVLDYGSNNAEAEGIEEGTFLSPLALAACMSIDSCFDHSLIPSTNLIVSYNLLRINFFNHFLETGCTPKLFPFIFDATSPVDQECMTLSLENPTMSFVKWSSRLKIEGRFGLTCDVLEYRNLTMLPVIDPIDFQGHATITLDRQKYPLVEAEIVFQPCFVKISQSVIHTLKYFLHSCCKDTATYKHCSEHMLPNYYMICNNTQEKICFGQIDTDESIILASQKMHAYSWRSHKKKQMLRICLESLKWKWSNSFCIDECGIQIVSLDNGITINAKVKSISNLQKQVIIDGQLIVSSRLNTTVQLQLSYIDSNPVEISQQNFTKTLAPNATTSSFVVPQTQSKTLYLSFMADVETLSWSCGITISECDQNEVIKVPWKDKQFKNVFLRTVHQKLQGIVYFTAVFLCPLFVIRNHLPRSLITNVKPSEKGETYSISTEGKGQETQLNEGTDINCSIDLSFQISSSSMKVSTPPLTVSAADLKNLPLNTEFDTEDIEKLCMEWHSNQRHLWPYSNLEGSLEDASFENVLYPCWNNSCTFPAVLSSETANTELKVNLSQRWKGLNTILVDVKPWALIINRLRIELYLIESNGKKWKMAPNSVVMPPPLKEQFQLGIQFDDEQFSSIPLRLLHEKSPKYQAQFKSGIPCNGLMNIIININSEKNMLCIFQLKSEICEGIRIMTAFPLVAISNNSEHVLHLSLHASSMPTKKMILPEKITALVTSQKKNDLIHPLLFWETFQPLQLHTLSEDSLQLAFYLSFCICESFEHQWSRPVCWSSNLPADMRQTVAVPVTPSQTSCTTPLVVTCHQRRGHVFLTVSEDCYPLILLHNKTSLLLFYGQACPETEGVTIYEEKEENLQLPFLHPESTSYYTPPTMQNQFPVPVDNFPKLHLGWKDDINSFGYVWSTPIDINLYNQFINIPEACYVRIRRESYGHTIYLLIDSVNRIEFTAKEIRSRIPVNSHQKHVITNTDMERVKLNSTVLTEATPLKAEKMESALPSDCAKSGKLISNTNNVPFALYLSIRATRISFIICDELQNVSKRFEILRLNIDNALMFSRTNVMSQSSQQIQEISLSFEHIQLDNQMNPENNVYDFPVVLKPHNCSKLPSEFKEGVNIFLPNKAREKAFLVIDMVLDTTSFEQGGVLQRVSMKMQPVSLYLEDALYYKIMNLFKSYIPFGFHEHRSVWKDFYLPNDVVYISASFMNPLHIQYFKIDIKDVFLSIHASLKLYLAIESSLLRFQPFEKTELFTDFYELGRMFVIHYLTGALFRAGWVVGALDLLGNPAGFARALGTGMTDFVLLPYRGLLNGPRAFITGLSYGAAALFTQISSGAVTCVTNLAASISRNMDLLSLDADHLARQELLRRQLPTGVARGLLQGLNGLGISLLGAVAGIVDHPLQVLVTPSSPINTAAGIVGGVGKGIVGVLTKPIGGAAELVSQTGHGLLQGAGWLSQPTRLYLPNAQVIEEFSNSSLKYTCKLIPSSALGVLLFAFEVTHMDESGHFEGNILLLTSEVLCVLNTEDDSQQRTFSLAEIKCQKSDSDRSRLLVIHGDRTENAILQDTIRLNDRVAEYVQKNWLYKSGETEFSIEDALTDSTDVFFIHPKYRSFFLDLFHSAKRKQLGKGFSI